MGILPLVGKHDVTVDEKGRLSIPAVFRNALPSDTQRHVVLTIGNDDCINVFPVDYFNAIYAPSENESALFALEESMDRDMKLLEESEVVQIDAQGRITIPKSLLKRVNIGQKAVFFGRHKFFTIWNAETYQARSDKVRMTRPEAWDMLAGKSKPKDK